MLINPEGKQQPEVVAREESSPTFAKLMKLTIDPARLDGADRVQFYKWFATRSEHVFTLTNPDGQKADLDFSLPPGVSQKATTTAEPPAKKAKP
jgi:hypothetical protein